MLLYTNTGLKISYNTSNDKTNVYNTNKQNSEQIFFTESTNLVKMQS